MKKTSLMLTVLVLAGMLEVDAAKVSWSARNLSDPKVDVSTEGVLLEALNFSGGKKRAKYDTTLNGVLFKGLVNGRARDAKWDNPSAGHFSANSNRVVKDEEDSYDTSPQGGGIPVYDVLLSQYLWGNAGTAVTLQGLVPGKSYQVQLFFADTFPQHRFIVIDHGSDSAWGGQGITDSKCMDANDPARKGLVITGKFTADADAQLFVISQLDQNGKETNNSFRLSAYQLRETTERYSTIGLIVASFSAAYETACPWGIL